MSHEHIDPYDLLQALIAALENLEISPLTHLNQRVQGERSTHHRKARCFGGTDEAANIVTVESHLHAAWHALFGPGEPRTIEQLMNHMWLDPNWQALLVHKRDQDSIRRAVTLLNKIAGPHMRVYLGRNVHGSRRKKREQQASTERNVVAETPRRNQGS